MKHPYYIMAPPYRRTSAGARVLYQLCHEINALGGQAFIYLRPGISFESAASPMHVAPFLTKEIRDFHFEKGLTPIVIYPEIFNIAKFNAPFKIRYLLNYNDLLIKNAPLTEDDYLLCYSEKISEQITIIKPRKTIFIPVSDAEFYSPPAPNSIRSGSVFYAGKYKDKFKGKTYDITNNSIEITRDKPNSQTPVQIRELFQTSEVFYSYEDTALIIEAMLCGCPVVLLTNDYFKIPLGDIELGGTGYSIDYSHAGLLHAQQTVNNFRLKYNELLKKIRPDTLDMIFNTQKLVNSIKYTTPFALNILNSKNKYYIIHNIMFILSNTISDIGYFSTIKIIIRRIFSLRLKIF